MNQETAKKYLDSKIKELKSLQPGPNRPWVTNIKATALELFGPNSEQYKEISNFNFADGPGKNEKNVEERIRQQFDRTAPIMEQHLIQFKERIEKFGVYHKPVFTYFAGLESRTQWVILIAAIGVIFSAGVGTRSLFYAVKQTKIEKEHSQLKQETIALNDSNRSLIDTIDSLKIQLKKKESDTSKNKRNEPSRVYYTRTPQ